jgi:hypothetical protein
MTRLTNEQIITPEDLIEAEKFETLSPAYFAARRVTERAMAAFTDEHLKPLIDKAADEFRDKLWTQVQDSIWSDTEMNLQGTMWCAIDEIVKALMGGQQWALKRYIAGPSYDCDKIREAAWSHALRIMPDAVLTARIAELEEQNKRLTEQVERRREYF